MHDAEKLTSDLIHYETTCLILITLFNASSNLPGLGEGRVGHLERNAWFIFLKKLDSSLPPHTCSQVC